MDLAAIGQLHSLGVIEGRLSFCTVIYVYMGWLATRDEFQFLVYLRARPYWQSNLSCW